MQQSVMRSWPASSRQPEYDIQRQCLIHIRNQTIPQSRSHRSLSKTVNSSSSSSSSLLDIFAVRGPNHVTRTDKYMRAHKNIKKQSDTI